MVRPLTAFVVGPAPIETWWFEFTPGVTVLYGRNGAGKTRLLRALSRLGEPDPWIEPNTGVEFTVEDSSTLFAGVIRPDHHPRRGLIGVSEFLVDTENAWFIADDIIERLSWMREVPFGPAGPLLSVRYSPGFPPAVWYCTDAREDLRIKLDSEWDYQSDSGLDCLLANQYELAQMLHMAVDDLEEAAKSHPLGSTELVQALQHLLSRGIEEMFGPGPFSIGSLMFDYLMRSGGPSFDFDLTPGLWIPQWAPVSVGYLGSLPPDLASSCITDVIVDPGSEFDGCSRVSGTDLPRRTLDALIETVIKKHLAANPDPQPITDLQKVIASARQVAEALYGPSDAHEVEPERLGEVLFERGVWPPQVSSDLQAEMQVLSSRASALVQLLLIEPPTLTCHIRPPSTWLVDTAVEWTASFRDDPSSEIPLKSLSSAEERWCNFAIELSIKEPELILIDEPERGLHRRAQRHLAAGLRQLAETTECSVIVSSHSPEFLKDSSNRLVHVTRDSTAKVRTRSLKTAARESLDELGLDTVDLLQLTDRFVIVEGEHDRVAIETILSEYLADLRAVVLPMRGTKNLAATLDSQLLLDFTEAGLVIVLDNTTATIAEGMQRDIAQAVLGGDKAAIERLLSGWKPQGHGNSLTPEEKKLVVFFQEAAWKTATGLRLDRITAFGFEKADIIEYLDCSTLVPGKTSWNTLRDQHRSHSGTPWKKWLSDQHGAEFSLERIRSASEAVRDNPPPEFLDLVQAIKSVPKRGC